MRHCINIIRNSNRNHAVTKKDKPDDTVLSFLKNVILVIAVYAYFVGWTYAFYFYSYFGLSLNAIDIPFYFFIIYSYNIFYNYIALLIIVVTVVLIYLLTTIYANKWLLMLVLVALFPALFYMSYKVAVKDAEEIRTGVVESKKVYFVLKKDIAKYYPKGFSDLNNYKLKLLTQTKDGFYVFHQPPMRTVGNDLVSGFTYYIPRDDVATARIVMPTLPIDEKLFKQMSSFK